MSNEFVKSDLAGVLADARTQIELVTRLQRERAELTGTATVLNHRITVTVNADGVVVETKFGPGIEDLGYSEIARGITDAAQRAVAEVNRKTDELRAPLDEFRAKIPKLRDLVANLPELTLPPAPKPSLAPPDSSRTGSANPDELVFRDVESLPDPTRRITDSSW